MYVGLKQPRGDGGRYVTPARAAAKETKLSVRATPIIVFFRSSIQIFRRASLTYSYGSFPRGSKCLPGSEGVKEWNRPIISNGKFKDVPSYKKPCNAVPCGFISTVTNWPFLLVVLWPDSWVLPRQGCCIHSLFFSFCIVCTQKLPQSPLRPERTQKKWRGLTWVHVLLERLRTK